MLRFARRLANWEEELPAEELQVREFKARDGGPDLRPSVYEIERTEERVQIYAEHAHRIEPPRRALAIRLAVAERELKETPGDTPFELTRERHREIALQGTEELMSLIREADGAPKQIIERSEVQEYVRGKLAASDTEWSTVATAPEAKRWLVDIAEALRSARR